MNEHINVTQTTDNNVNTELVKVAQTTGAKTGTEQTETKSLAIKRYNMKEYFNKQFPRDVENFRIGGKLKSGYMNLDMITNLYPGLYVIGAISSLGKTTFIHQMAEQMAEAGSHVLFFSLEQSVLDLASKSIARSIAKADAEHGLTSLQVRRADSTEPRIVSAVNKCSAYAEKMTIIECSFRATMNNIVDAVNGYISATGQKPVVIIDYLQVIQSDPESHLTTKDMVDSHVRRLKELQTDHNLTMIVISSLNRQNYMTPIDYESFKESGGIEYTADVLWGLQLQCLNEEAFTKQNNIADKRKRIKEAKRENPRKIELVCLKNRFGISSYSCYFDYYPNFDLFEPDPENIDFEAAEQNNTDTDGFYLIPEGINPNIPFK